MAVEVTLTFMLSSAEPPSIPEGLADQLAPPGSSASFTCAARGNPHPNVTWLFNAEPVVPSRRVQIAGSTLLVSDVTPRDEGVYQCLLDNGVGSAQSHGILTAQSGLFNALLLNQQTFLGQGDPRRRRNVFILN